MVFYGLAFLSGTVFTMLCFKDNENSRKAFFLLGTLFLVLLGVFQRRFLPLEARFLHLLSVLISAVIQAAPGIVGLFSLAIAFHAFRKLKRRGPSRKYLFLFFIGSSSFFLWLLTLANRIWWSERLFYHVEFLYGIFLLYTIFTFAGFIMLAFLYRLIQPDAKKDFVIVLGAGLLPNGKISSLLKYRLDQAFDFYTLQKKMDLEPAKIIVSGGKGPLDVYSEAEVMKKYLIAKGIPTQQIFMEDQSVNTHQNFLYSKRLIKEMGAEGKILFVTNNFHVFRAGIYARQAGVTAEAVGAPTPPHYLPYALLREYLATMFIYRTFHFYALIVIAAAALILFR